MSKNSGLPELIFPGRNLKKKDPYKLTVWVVEEEDADGCPRRLRLVKDDERVEVEEGMKFIMAYIPKHVYEGVKQ